MPFASVSRAGGSRPVPCERPGDSSRQIERSAREPPSRGGSLYSGSKGGWPGGGRFPVACGRAGITPPFIPRSSVRAGRPFSLTRGFGGNEAHASLRREGALWGWTGFLQAPRLSGRGEVSGLRCEGRWVLDRSFVRKAFAPRRLPKWYKASFSPVASARTRAGEVLAVEQQSLRMSPRRGALSGGPRVLPRAGSVDALLLCTKQKNPGTREGE